MATNSTLKIFIGNEKTTFNWVKCKWADTYNNLTADWW